MGNASVVRMSELVRLLNPRAGYRLDSGLLFSIFVLYFLIVYDGITKTDSNCKDRGLAYVLVLDFFILLRYFLLDIFDR